MKKHLVAAFALIVLAGCAPKAADVDEAGPQVVEPEPVPPPYEQMSAEDRATCEAEGGQVMRLGLAGGEGCVKPYADAGKSCTDSDQCEGMCLASGDPAPPEGPVPGQCQRTDSPFGCYRKVTDGRIEYSICVD